jgi:outer membrane immunogenic protein
MKKFLMGAAVLFLPTAAIAADLPSYKASPAPAYVDPWNGFYLGADLGYVGANPAGVVNTTPFSFTQNGFSGGGYAGYNWRLAPLFLVGVDADLGYIGLTSPSTFPALDSGWYGDITGRAGVTLGPALIYAKGGWAYYSGGTSFTGAWNGWVIGGGVEYSLSRNVSVKAEYLHFDFGSQTSFVVPTSIGLTMDTAKVGVAYHF